MPRSLHKTLPDMTHDFLFLKHELAYCDNASTTQKPTSVIAAMRDYEEHYCANVHRGLYAWSERATIEVERVRVLTQRFIGAEHAEEIIFTSGTTASLNLAARLIVQDLQPGDAIMLSVLEHHAQLVPWHIIAKERGLTLQFLSLTTNGEIDVEEFDRIVTPQTKILAITHMSNVSGYIVPIAQLSAKAHARNMIVVIDAAQSAGHIPINVTKLGIDCLAFSGHKVYGPTGIGIFYARQSLLKKWKPVIGGGQMIDEVFLTHSTWTDIPAKFEPGTPNIVGIIGLGAALQYITTLGWKAIHHQEQMLTTIARKKINALVGVKLFIPQNSTHHANIFSFTVDGVHPHDVAAFCDRAGVMVRAGHHCAQPLHRAWNVPATVRASFAIYNTTEDVDRLIQAIINAQNILKQ